MGNKTITTKIIVIPAIQYNILDVTFTYQYNQQGRSYECPY